MVQKNGGRCAIFHLSFYSERMVKLMVIGKRIAQIRKSALLSQEAFGESLGVSRQAISKWESGASIPDVEKLIQMSKMYNAPVGWILGVE